MGFKNGRVPKNALRSIEGQPADVRVANAYDRLKVAAKKAGYTIKLVGGGLSAYRSWAVQDKMHKQGKAVYGVPIAPAGTSTHGLGTALDIVATTAAGRAWLQTHAGKYGFTRNLLGIGDVNHYQHNLKTAIGAPKAVVKKAITYANKQKLSGPKSAAAKNGIPGDVARARIKQLAKRDGLTGYSYVTLYQIYSNK